MIVSNKELQEISKVYGSRILTLFALTIYKGIRNDTSEDRIRSYCQDIPIYIHSNIYNICLWSKYNFLFLILLTKINLILIFFKTLCNMSKYNKFKCCNSVFFLYFYLLFVIHSYCISSIFTVRLFHWYICTNYVNRRIKVTCNN